MTNLDDLMWIGMQKTANRIASIIRKFWKPIFSYHVIYNFSLTESKYGFGSINVRSKYKIDTEESVNKVREFVQKELEKDPQYKGVSVVLTNWIRLKNVESL